MQTSHRVQHPSATRRGTTRSAWAFVLAGVTAAVLTGCSFQIEEAICGGGEYPVPTVGSTGGDCVPNGEAPPAGYARHPEGKVAEHVGDKWDTYWSTHTLDEQGNIVDAPTAGRAPVNQPACGAAGGRTPSGTGWRSGRDGRSPSGPRRR